MIMQDRRKKRLGDILISKEIITEEQLTEALQKQKETNKLLGDTLIELKFVTQEQITEAIKAQLGIQSIKLAETRIANNATRVINDIEFLKRSMCMPFKIEENKIHLAMADPLNSSVVNDVAVMTGLRVVVYMTDYNDIMTSLDRYYGNEEIQGIIDSLDEVKDDKVINMSDEVAESEDAPLIRLVNAIFEKAVRSKASDIHIEPMEHRVRVRYRIDGDLVEQKNSYQQSLIHSIIARLKVLSGLDISEKRKPQDGRITIYVDDTEYDVRLSILPTAFGEKAVMRLTNKSKLTMEKSKLGLLPEDEKKFNSLLENSHGIILVTGPTGSGKSTTLYTALSELNREHVNILTIEDPIEANLDGLNQVQVNNKAGLTFPSALRSFLRQDPDIIMVGEIRDTETASLAVDASLTGHLVVSTLHTNSSVSTISRLQKMGIESYLIADALEGVLAQRLVKRLCDCKKPHKLSVIERKKLGLTKEQAQEFECFEPCGCVKCNNTGYSGRIAVYEILVLTNRIKEAIANEEHISEIEAMALDEGLCTLKTSCIKLIGKGITSIQELDRIVHDPTLREEEDSEDNE